jgi:hypothetical protein
MIGQFRNFFAKKVYLLEYSEAFINKLATRLAAGDTDMLEPIKGYIRYFDTVRNRNDVQLYIKNNPAIFQRGGKPITDVKNVDVFNATQLEHIYDHFNAEAKNKKKEEEAQQPITKDADLLFPDDVSKTNRTVNPAARADDSYLEIYRGGNQASCVKFSHDVFGQSYEFCIGRQNSSNMYTNYRFGSMPRTFYFVRDYSRPTNDDLHLIVVHAQKDGTFRYTNAPNNNGDKFVGSWENLVAEQPKLKDHKDLFKFIPFSEQEEDVWALKHADGAAFFTLSPRLQNAFLQTKKPLPINIFTQLSTANQNLYIQSFAENLYGAGSIATYGTGTGGNVQNYKFYVDTVIETAKKHTEWGLEVLYNLFEKYIGDTRFVGNQVTNITKIIFALSLLKFNSKYYFNAQGEVVPRDEERLQPVRNFIRLVTTNNNTAIDSSQIEKILNTTYSNVTDMAQLVYLSNGATRGVPGSGYTIIKCQNEYVLTFDVVQFDNSNMRTPGKHKVLMVVTDEQFNIVSAPAYMEFTTKTGFVVTDTKTSKTFLLKISPEGEIIADYNADIAELSNSDNFVGKFTKENFDKLPPEAQKIQFFKRIEALANKLQSYREHTPQQLHQVAYNLDFNCIFDRPYYTQDTEMAWTILLKSFSKTFPKSSFNTLTRSGYSSALCTPLIQAIPIYDLCKKFNIVDYFNSYIKPTLIKVLKSYQLHYHKDSMIVTDDIYFGFTERPRDASAVKISLKDFTLLDAGIILMKTKSNYIIGPSASLKDINKISGINVETTEEMPAEQIEKVKTTLTSISKLRGNEAADVLATTYTNYYFNPKFFAELSKKTGARKKFIHSKMPPFAARNEGKTLNVNAVVIDTQNNKQLQEKYLKFLIKAADSFKYVISLFEIFEMQLAGVIFDPEKSWRPNTFTIGFLFAKNNIDFSKSDIRGACAKNCLYIEAKDIQTYTIDENRVRLPASKPKENFFTSENALSTIRLNNTKVYIHSNGPGIVKSKTINLQNFIQTYLSFKPRHLASLINQTMYPDAHINDMLIPAIQKAVLDHHHNRSASKPPVTEESVKYELPFSLYYKIIDSV